MGGGKLASESELHAVHGCIDISVRSVASASCATRVWPCNHSPRFRV